MNKKNRLLAVILLFFVPSISFAQQHFRVMFYNVENLFDTEDDPAKDDAEFLPEGLRHWTEGRYRNKLNNIAKVVTAVGAWDTPALIGLCEVENDKTLKDLVNYSVLRKQDYRYVMTQSGDLRGIDVALMYQRDQFKYLKHESYVLKFPKSPRRKTRDVLHVTGIVAGGDTLDVFVCHFPSRRGGEAESEPDRVLAASLVRSKVDLLMKIRKNPCVIIMGDFNDEPSDKSISGTLAANFDNGKYKETSLYNLFYPLSKQEDKGSYKFQSQWNLLDQVIVSGHLMDRKQKLHVLPATATIFSPDFLLVKDKTHGGKRPKKTYSGMKHEGGFSDHLPVYVDFEISPN